MYPRIEGGGLRRYRIKVHRALYVFKEHGTSVEGTLPATLFFIGNRFHPLFSHSAVSPR